MHANQPLETGIGSYTFTWAVGVAGQAVAVPMTAFDLIEKASELNATVVQFADNMPLDRFPEEKLHDLQLSESKSIRLEAANIRLAIENHDRLKAIEFVHIISMRFSIRRYLPRNGTPRVGFLRFGERRKNHKNQSI